MRPSPKGFSKNNHSKKLEKNLSNNFLGKSNYSISDEKSLTGNTEHIETKNNQMILTKIENIHWANRDFIEYKNVA